MIDLLRHLPVSVIDRTARPSVDDAEDGQTATFEILVLKADIPPPRSRRPARVTAETTGGQIELVFFHAQTDYLKTTLPVGERRLISGRVERFQGRLQMPHPDFILPIEKADNMPEFEPVYPLTAGLKARTLTNAIQAGLKTVPSLEDWIDEEVKAARRWPEFICACCRPMPRKPLMIYHRQPLPDRVWHLTNCLQTSLPLVDPPTDQNPPCLAV